MDSKPDHGKGSEANNRMNASFVNWITSQLLICVTLTTLSLAAVAEAKTPDVQKHYTFDLPQQSVADSLNDLAKYTGAQFLFPFQLAQSKTAKPITGHFTLLEATAQLLQNTGLKSDLVDGVLTISPADDAGTSGNQNHKGKRMNITTKKSLLATMVGLFAATGAAQQAYGQDGEAATAQRALDEIIVTAEKREQNLQDVPVAISAFSADMLEARGIVTPQDLQFSVPGLEIGEQFQGPAKVTMRGVGSENIFPGGDPGVPLHINGHYTQNTAYVLRDMLDVERVEVLRGPQGTLYGRNAIGGTINIITKRPTDEVEGSLSATVGNYDKRTIQAVISGPFSDSLRGRLAVSDDKRDGYVENVGIPGDDRETSDYTSIRGALEFDLTEDIQLYFGAYYFDDVGNPGQRRLSEYPTGPVDGGPNYYELNNAGTNPTLSDPFKISNNTASENTNESKGASLDIIWDLGVIEFRSLSAYDDSLFDVLNDGDGSSVVNRQFNFFMPFETFTQEFQLLSIGTNDFNWVLGLFYYDEESSYTFQFLREQSTTDADGNGVVDQNDPRRLVSLNNEVESTSLGVYGQIDYALTEQLELVAGLRYSQDEKSAVDSGLSIGVEGQPIPAPIFGATPFREEDWSEVTGKLGLNYHINDYAMVYGSVSRGYKAGGFNLLQASPYDPEQVDAFEAGLKSRWMDDRVQLNVAAFYYDYTNKQDFQRFIAPSGQVVFDIVNAAAATSSGLEFEVQAKLTDALFVDFSLGYLNAEIDEFINIDSTAPIGGGLRDLSGNQLPFSPELSMHLGVQYDWTLDGVGGLSARIDYSRTDEQFSNVFNRDSSSGLGGDADFVPSYYLINARLQWVSTDTDWLAELYVRNLTDEVNLSNPFVANAEETFGTYLPPRTYGLKVTYSF